MQIDQSEINIMDFKTIKTLIVNNVYEDPILYLKICGVPMIVFYLSKILFSSYLPVIFIIVGVLLTIAA
jgi:hypothetical protein